MTINDLYLLSPELSLSGLAILLLLLDLGTNRKGLLSYVAIMGLIVPLGFTVSLWLNSTGVAENSILSNTFVVDKFSIFFKLLFISAVAIIGLISREYVKKLHHLQVEYFALVLFSVTGMMLLSSAVELITIYISLELTAIPIAALAAFLKNSRSSESGMKFLLLSGISSALLLYGMVLVYGFTGSTVLGEISAQLRDIGLSETQPFGSYALLMGIVLIIAGFGFKITAVPFQMWAPDVYEGSPTPITAFLSVASKAAGFAVILRVFHVGFPLEVLSIEWSAIFAVLAAISMSFGNLVAIAQTNIKRMLAYSTVAHAGYIMVGIAAIAIRVPDNGTAIGVSSVLFYLVGYATMNLAAFSAVIAISNRIESDNIKDFTGMGKRAPLMAAILAFAMVSLTGVPPTVGFMAKIYIFGAAINTGFAWLAVIGVLNSVVSAYYYLRVIKVMYLSTPQVDEKINSPTSLQLAAVATAAGILIFGIFPRPLLDLVKTAAEALRSVS